MLDTMGRPKKLNKTKPVTLPTWSIKARQEWHEWHERFAKHLGMSKSELVDAALIELARQRGFKEMPPPRSR